MGFVKFEVTGDDDGSIELSISVSNGKYSATQDVWVYPRDITEFGNALKNFPQKLNDEVVFKCGSDGPSVDCYVKIRVFIFDNAGHPAIEILFNNHQQAPDYADSHFYVKCEVNTLNKLGYALSTWVNNMNEPIRMELDEL